MTDQITFRSWLKEREAELVERIHNPGAQSMGEWTQALDELIEVRAQLAGTEREHEPIELPF